MDGATLARDRLLMAVLLSVVVHILLLFGPFGPGIASTPRITPEMPLTLELQRAIPQRSQPMRLVAGAWSPGPPPTPGRRSTNSRASTSGILTGPPATNRPPGICATGS